MSRYYSVLVITVVVINGLHCILSWTVCLAGLSDRFETKKDRPKTGYRVKEEQNKSSKKHHPAHTKHNSAKNFFTL